MFVFKNNCGSFDCACRKERVKIRAGDKIKKSAARQFKEIKPTLTRVTGTQAAAVLAALGPYRQMLEPQRQHLLSLYRPVDVAFKVVGTGSVGLRDYCIYFEGNGPADPLFLQIKEEPASGYAPYLPEAAPPHHNGQRVAEGQKAMQVQSDPFLGWTHFGGRDYLVRQLNDHKGSIDLEDLAGSGLEAYAEVCGELLARGHARSGDPLILNGYIGSGDGFADALAKFGLLYADQTEKDWNALKRSAKRAERDRTERYRHGPGGPHYSRPGGRRYNHAPARFQELRHGCSLHFST